MNVYLIILSSYPGEKVIANNVIEAINKYLEKYKNYDKDINKRLSCITSVKYLEKFDYIQ